MATNNGDQPAIEEQNGGHEEEEAKGSSTSTKSGPSNPMGKGVSTLGATELTDELAKSSQDAFSMERIKKAVELLHLVNAGPAKTTEDAMRKNYKFWETQPVPKIDEEVLDNGAINKNQKVADIRKEPYHLPGGFVWDTLDIANEEQLKEVYLLLNENYVEDDDNMFRFDYSPEFLMWALKPPGWIGDWHCGVRVEKSQKLVGFISAIPAQIKVHNENVKMVEINFLCVHKKLRSKRMAPVLIKEITRRVNLRGIYQAVYTAGVVIPKPVATCRYWHRSLNPKKLIDVKFSHLSRNMTMTRTIKLYKLPETTKLPGFRKLEKKDVKKVCKLLNDYLQNFELSPHYSVEEFAHWFMPRTNVVDSFVVEESGDIKGFTSYYTLPSTVMHHSTYKNIKAAYSFYNVATEPVSLLDLVNDALVMAKHADYDVFNALDLMDNSEFLEKLKFGIGDGNLQYYLFNWKCPTIDASKVGLVLQ
ncbi:Glycylpeptide N-tetradecanoyltransferase 2 [Halotydeus destructor]|nr:Glycylpeptide N-tetradecanoyltransferase 2 [Halotydeus destructor]